MLAKILAGVVAAVVVAGVGTYYAYEGCPFSGCNAAKTCSSQNRPPVDPTDRPTTCPGDPTEVPSCCSAKAKTTVAAPGCCAAKTTVANNDNLAACVGGMALTSSATAKKTTVIGCCDE